MTDYSFVFNAHPAYIESMYEKYTQDPQQVEEGWRTFFKGFEFGTQSNGHGADSAKARVAAIPEVGQVLKEINVAALITAYRNRGHLKSTTNPIKPRRDRKPHLDLQDFGLTEADLDITFLASSQLGLEKATLREIVAKLEWLYCGNIGFEFHHIADREKRHWLRERIEKRPIRPDYGLNLEKKHQILEKLNGAVGFERFLHTKFVGQKRFSLEGGETTIAALDAIINRAAENNVEEVVMGMAHRGRLNVLANILGKTYEQIFSEFEGTMPADQSFGDGDVKYHLGFSSQVPANNGKMMQLKLVPNPSHLESVNPVLEGFTRAKADILYQSDYDKILPILIHGDAAMAGQGVVYETVQMSKLEGYYTGGTIHFVINNQIGFTTNFDEARSSIYCTAAADLVQAPVFHVNGDDPEAVVFVAEMALEYRQEFNNDVFIDMVCYRRHGHNEGDDPKFTQPEMYKLIQDHPDPRELYVHKLAERGDVEKVMAEAMEKEFWSFLQARLDEVKQKILPYQYQEPEQAWRQLNKFSQPEDFKISPATGVDRKRVEKILNHMLTVPEGFTPLGKVNRLLKTWQKMVENGQLDWSLAELLSYGSILVEGKDVRMSGQDVKRGTFSHRHAVFYDDHDYAVFNRIQGIEDGQGRFMIYNSLLSEFAVLGFEYGYSLATPNTLVLWEAQFGDFHNGAQTIVDQYIFSSESKWHRMSGLVMLLPHGYEGQGPEHSSGRLERFLQACAEYNVTVANPTTPASFFHLIRRQLARPFRKPLVIMSPKSLLRHPECISSISDFESGTSFHEVIDDASIGEKHVKKVKKLLLCSGKIFYDLVEAKKTHKREDIAIVRIEQLYPLPSDQLESIFKKYEQAAVVWVQEEPANMGAWQHVFLNLAGKVPISLISRKASASPATGFKARHDAHQAEIIAKAFE
jgi:2-oxoglutarate dehydrogenase E1 component